MQRGGRETHACPLTNTPRFGYYYFSKSNLWSVIMWCSHARWSIAVAGSDARCFARLGELTLLMMPLFDRSWRTLIFVFESGSKQQPSWEGFLLEIMRDFLFVFYFLYQSLIKLGSVLKRDASLTVQEVCLVWITLLIHYLLQNYLNKKL